MTLPLLSGCRPLVQKIAMTALPDEHGLACKPLQLQSCETEVFDGEFAAQKTAELSPAKALSRAATPDSSWVEVLEPGLVVLRNFIDEAECERHAVMGRRVCIDRRLAMAQAGLFLRKRRRGC